MANTLTSGDYFTTMTVDTAPGAAGAVCGTVREAIARDDFRLSFSVRGATGTVTLQFLADGDTVWQDEGEYEAGAMKLIDNRSHGRQWRAICKQGDFGDTGDLIFGLEW